jgi:hypothetical protein
LVNWKRAWKGKGQEASGLQQQLDQCLAHLQLYEPHLAAYQQLTFDKEALQTQLLEQLQEETV